MDLSKIIYLKSKAAQYMIDEITYICNTFEKRSPGSKGNTIKLRNRLSSKKSWVCFF